MADVIRRNHVTGEPRHYAEETRHRADEIHVHHRERRRSLWPFVLLGLLAVGLFALWNYSRRHRVAVEAPAVAPVERIEPAIPAPPAPPGPERPSAPVLPVPQAPRIEREKAAEPEKAAPEATGPDAGAAPSESETGAAATTGAEACEKTIFFAANETDLKGADKSELKTITECVKTTGKGITLEGHADPRGNAEYNRGLAQRRTESVVKELRAAGIPANQITTSVGELVCSDATEECWQKNRTVVISAQP